MTDDFTATDSPPPPRRTNEGLLLDFVSDQAANCPACSYNLRALTTARCPECGLALVLGVHAAERRLGYWVATLVACCLPAPAGVIILLGILQMGVSSSMFNGAAGILTVHCLASIPMLVAVLVWRQSFLKQSQAAQSSMAWWTGALLAVSFLALVSLLA